MLGSSRESLAASQDYLDTLRGRDGFSSLAADLYLVAGLLDAQPQLRSVLADSGQREASRTSLVRDVFAGRIGELAVDVLDDVVRGRWSNDRDLVIALESLAAQAAFTVAEADGTLDATEESLFIFERALDSSSLLQMALTDPAQSATVKAAIVRDLLADRASAATVQVLEYAVGHLHGQRIDAVVEALVALAARQRDRVVADVRVAAPLEDEQRRRLADLLTRLKSRPVRLNIAVDPAVIGGVLVQIGDEVIDGTIASRLEQARRAIVG